MPRFEDAAFGLGEAGQIESGELFELAFEGVEARLEFARGGTQGRGLGGSAIARAVGIAEEARARRRIGDLPGGEQRGGLGGADAVLLDGLGEAALVGGREGAEGVGGGRGKTARIDPRGELGSEFAGEGEAALGPAAAVTQELADRRGGQPIFVREGVHDPGFVHRAGGAARSVGLKKARLGADPGDVLDDDGDDGAALGFPLVEALVAVENLERAVARRSHAKGHGGKGRIGVGARSAQGGERRAQGIDGDLDDEGPHGRGSSSGRSWKRG